MEPQNIAAVVTAFRSVGRVFTIESAAEIGHLLTCEEAETLTVALRALDASQVASVLISSHNAADDGPGHPGHIHDPDPFVMHNDYPGDPVPVLAIVR